MRLAVPYGLNYKNNYIKRFADEREMKFVDSKSKYQFYPLSRIWEDIQTALAEKLTLVNLTSEPITADELYKELTGKAFPQKTDRDLEQEVVETYDVMSIHAQLFGGSENYICRKNEILGSIKQFAESASE